jgi:anti-sigma regulatory factor (Ser/Thr protein kinase)
MAALLYTDGLVERRGEGLDERLAQLCVSASGGGTPQEICDRVLRTVDAGEADDDVTLVVVRGEVILGDKVSLKLSPDPEALRALRRVLGRWLVEVGAEADEAHDIVMAANEAWQNALEHGTGFARTTVGVELEAAGEDVIVTVRDAGRRDRSPADPDRGRGIELMRALADEVSLELAPLGSTVRLRRTLRVRAVEMGAGADAATAGRGRANRAPVRAWADDGR